jgi:hypothetical protein
MKRALFFVIFLSFTISLFAVDLLNRSIFLEAAGGSSAQRAFFNDNFRMEATALGFTIVDRRDQAGFIFSFDVQSHTDDFDPSIRHIILVSLIHNESGMEMVSFGWPFAELDDMYDHNQFVFYRAAVLIPSLSDEELAELAELAMSAAVIDNRWRDKWIYLRASLDFPITFFVLQQTDDLLGGAAVYAPDNPDVLFQKLDHIIRPMPGATIGLEVQFLSFLSLEVNFQIGIDTTDNMHLNAENMFLFHMAAGAELKVPLKFGNFMISPYATFIYPLNVSPAYNDFPDFYIGGGIQFNVRGGRSGAFFVDLKYLMALEDTVVNNPWIPVFPEPPTISYNRFVIGIGIGYKFGIFDR